MADSKKYHVTPHEKGWQVKGEKAQRANSLHTTKEEAVVFAKKLARNNNSSQVIVHRKDGTIQNEFKYDQ
ncbi:MAG: DUF2188 domain-containing protein [Candidatus Marinimicrobia bacterium]|nr:DUF2188 domain-containing protein [Candidatus Neomarinimicrobiota bacterium]